MRPRLLRLALSAALLVATAGISYALTPDDAIYLSQEGVDPEIIIAKICADAEAWDLTAEEIVYLAQEGVSLDVINALIDPVSAAEKWGFTLGEPDAYIEEGEQTRAEEGYYPEDGYWIEESGGASLIFSLGYYDGPLAVYYFSHPYFYPYMFCDGFAFSYSYWPVYYRNYYYPWACGYYPYPYYAYGYGSYYYGDAYVGYYQHNYYGDHGDRVHQVGDVAYRGWSDERERKAAWRSDKPPFPEIRDVSGGDPGKEQLADGYRSRNDGGRGSNGFDPLPGDRRIGSEGTLTSGGPVGDVARVDGRTGTRRGGEIATVTPGKGVDPGSRRVGSSGTLGPRQPNQATERVSDIGSRRTIGTPRKIELPARRTVSLGTTRSNKSDLGRKVESGVKRSTTSEPRKVSSPRTITSSGKSSSGSNKSGSILKPNSSSKSTKAVKPSASSSKKSSPKISSGSSKKSAPAKKAPSVKPTRSSSNKSSATRSSKSVGRR